MVIRAADIPFRGGPPIEERIFRDRGDGRYSLEILPLGLTFDVDRLRRHSHELWGELAITVNGQMPLAKVIEGGILSIGDLNFSSVQARGTRAKLLSERAGTEALDWHGLLEEFCVKTIKAEREGTPEMNLQLVPRPSPDRMFQLSGVQLPLKHPTILFGDGGTAKSYLALYWGGVMMQAGHNILYVDWEFTPDEHRERLEFLFGPQFPAIRYLSCYRAIRDERERIQKAIRRSQITYMIFDSVGVACGGDPSGSEAATSYFQALRQLGEIGSLHIAHVTKGADNDQKPFGSAFWHNMARVTLNVKAEDINETTIALALYPRKRNLKGRAYPTGFTMEFGETFTTILSTDVKDHPVLAESLPIAERMLDALNRGAKTRRELAELLSVPYDIIQRTAHREVKRGKIVELEGAKGIQKLALKVATVG